MDARVRRSRRALVEAVFRLSVENGIDNLTVTDVSAAADVSRDTFYRHAAEPLELLCNALKEELDESLSAGPTVANVEEEHRGLFALAVAVMESMRNRAAIYRQARKARNGARLTMIVETAVRHVIDAHLDAYPECLPTRMPPTAVTRDMVAAFATAGATAAFFSWVCSDELTEVRRHAEAALMCGPQWMLGLPPHQRSAALRLARARTSAVNHTD